MNKFLDNIIKLFVKSDEDIEKFENTDDWSENITSKSPMKDYVLGSTYDKNHTWPTLIFQNGFNNLKDNAEYNYYKDYQNNKEIFDKDSTDYNDNIAKNTRDIDYLFVGNNVKAFLLDEDNKIINRLLPGTTTHVKDDIYDTYKIYITDKKNTDYEDTDYIIDDTENTKEDEIEELEKLEKLEEIKEIEQIDFTKIFDDEIPSIDTLDTNYNSISKLYIKYKNLLINENIINSWINGDEISTLDIEKLSKKLDNYITHKYNLLTNQYFNNLEDDDEKNEVSSVDILRKQKELISHDIEQLQKNKKTDLEDSIVLSQNYDDIKKENLLNELLVILEDIQYVKYKYELHQNLSEADKKSISISIRANFIKTIKKKITNMKVQIYESQNDELKNEIDNNLDTNMNNIMEVTYLQDEIKIKKKERDFLYKKYNIQKEEDTHILWGFKGYFMFLLQAFGIILWIFMAHMSYNIFIQSGYWWIFAITFALLGGIGIVIHYLWIPFLGLLICAIRKVWIGTGWFGMGIGLVILSKFLKMCGDGFHRKNFAKDIENVKEEDAGFFWWFTHKYNDTTNFGLGLDWSSFWWKYYDEIPTWTQHALCFFKCKFQGLTIPICPENYKNFEFAYNHFIYKILTGIFGDGIFKNTIDLNRNQLPAFGGFR